MAGPTPTHSLPCGICLTVSPYRTGTGDFFISEAARFSEGCFFFFCFFFLVKLFEVTRLTVLGQTEFNLSLSNQIMEKMPGKWLPNSSHCSEITELGEFVR